MEYLPMWKPDARCWHMGQKGIDSPPDKSRPVNIAGIAVRERMPPMFVDRPCGFALFLCIQFDDPVQILLKGRRVLCGPRSLIIWPPNVPHWFGESQRHWSHTWMYGSGTKFAPLLASCGLPYEVPIILEERGLTERYFFSLYQELHRHQHPDDIIVEALFTAWLREVARAHRSHAQAEPIPERLLGVIEAVQRDLSKRHSLPELAQLAALSVSQFSHIFRQHFGTAPIEYFLNLRLQRALYYLSDHNLNMTEIAARVGFADSLYFSKQFKRRYGKSPLQYRKANYGQLNRQDAGGRQELQSAHDE